MNTIYLDDNADFSDFKSNLHAKIYGQMERIFFNEVYHGNYDLQIKCHDGKNYIISFHIRYDCSEQDLLDLDFKEYNSVLEEYESTEITILDIRSDLYMDYREMIGDRILSSRITNFVNLICNYVIINSLDPNYFIISDIQKIKKKIENLYKRIQK